MEHIAYLSLGSNVGDREANLRRALQNLSALGEIVAKSSVYETEPMEVVDQPWFLNAVIKLRTGLPPSELLRALLKVERSMGRVREQAKGPRQIDIDILLYDDAAVNEPGLAIPHPAMHQRMFVLAPLAEIAPNVMHPILQLTTTQLRDQLTPDEQRVRRIDAPWFNNA